VKSLGRVGIWSRELLFGEAGDARDASAELGFGTLWIPGGGGGDLLEVCADRLAVTRDVAIATGILNVFGHDPRDVAREHAQIDVDQRWPRSPSSTGMHGSRLRVPGIRHEM
jgi:hypothetical protein